MYKYLKNLVLLTVASCFLFVGCGVKDSIKTVLDKTYTLCVNLQTVIAKSNAQEFSLVTKNNRQLSKNS